MTDTKRDVPYTPLEYHPVIGGDIISDLAKCYMVAHLTRMNVRLKFNGVWLVVKPDSNISFIYKEYLKKIG